MCDGDIRDIAAEVSARDAVFVARRSEMPKPRLLREEELIQGAHVLIVPNSLIPELVPHDLSGSGVWILNEGQDPVIELIISRIEGEVLHSGRLYFLPYAVDSQAQHFIDKPDQIRVLADDLFTWARKWTRRAGGRPCGPAAARRVGEGQLRLAAPNY
jgi:hypothetical protein